MKPLRIALLMIEPPLPFGNAAARWFYVLFRGLVARGHCVTAFATCSQAQDIEAVRAYFAPPCYDLRCYTHPVRRGLRAKWNTLRQPYSYVFSPALRHDLAAMLADGVDVLHLEQLWSGWLGLSHTPQAVLNLHYLFEIDSADRRPRSLAEYGRRAITCRAEGSLLRRYPHIMTLSDRLSTRVRMLHPRANVHTVPLGLDLSLYPYEREKTLPHRPVIALIGSFDWQPTYTAGVRLLTRLWPEIKRRVPRARLQIVGRAASTALGRFTTLPDVEIYENVPDTRPYFRHTDVLLYPVHTGSGMKVKVLEAFALGVPVVTTAAGVEGLPAHDGIHVDICEDDAGLIHRTVSLIQNRRVQQRRRLAARQLLEAHCNPHVTLDAVEQVYTTLVQPPGVSPAAFDQVRAQPDERNV